MSSSNCEVSVTVILGTSRGTPAHQIVHESVTAHDHDIALSHTDIIPFRILHRLVSAVRTQLEGKIERVLHLVRPEHDLSSANEQKAAVTEIGDEERRVVQQCQETGRRSVNTLR